MPEFSALPFSRCSIHAQIRHGSLVLQRGWFHAGCKWLPLCKSRRRETACSVCGFFDSLRNTRRRLWSLRRDNQEVRGAAPVDQQKYRLLVRSREGLPILLDIPHWFAVHFLNDVAPLETGFGGGARWIDARHQHTSNRRR